MTPLDGLFDIRVFKHYIWTFPAELKSHLLQPCRAGNFLAYGGRSSKCDLIDPRVTHDRSPGNLPKSGHDVNRTRRETRFLDQGAEIECAKRGLFRSFENNGISTGERRGYLPR